MQRGKNTLHKAHDDSGCRRAPRWARLEAKGIAGRFSYDESQEWRGFDRQRPRAERAKTALSAAAKAGSPDLETQRLASGSRRPAEGGAWFCTGCRGEGEVQLQGRGWGWRKQAQRLYLSRQEKQPEGPENNFVSDVLSFRSLRDSQGDMPRGQSQGRHK